MPLTTTGIAIQILASIRAHRENLENCTTNDCKVVVNYLIRKFSEPLGRVNESQVKMSASVAAGEGGNTVRDHAVPVIILLEELLQWPDTHVKVTLENASRVEEFLRKSLLIVEVTRNEDLVLCNRGYQRAMPPCWSNSDHAWFQDPLARYKECGIEV
ncbi:hypothetical protein [Polaromonas sp. JS666]|uniref:hypothetical protein n=1 Tax=Polaromonas sp. (strain JS666 / ATCC BAA-500) TaxID=296591 RepID=UPI0000536C96|nr:hypothetical protein [Polaromonas sp. JS666]ABE46942.1 hypothetical protein Bpro_5070 [Polaromonas sp. JS666]